MDQLSRTPLPTHAYWPSSTPSLTSSFLPLLHITSWNPLFLTSWLLPTPALKNRTKIKARRLARSYIPTSNPTTFLPPEKILTNRNKQTEKEEREKKTWSRCQEAQQKPELTAQPNPGTKHMPWRRRSFLRKWKHFFTRQLNLERQVKPLASSTYQKAQEWILSKFTSSERFFQCFFIASFSQLIHVSFDALRFSRILKDSPPNGTATKGFPESPAHRILLGFLEGKGYFPHYACVMHAKEKRVGDHGYAGHEFNLSAIFDRTGILRVRFGTSQLHQCV